MQRLTPHIIFDNGAIVNSVALHSLAEAKGLSMNTCAMPRDMIDGVRSILHFVQYYDDGGLVKRELTAPISTTMP